MSDKLLKISDFNSKINELLGLNLPNFAIFRSKGLLAHLLKRKHFVAAKYLDFLPEIITSPDYAGFTDGAIELVKCFKDDIFVSIKLDADKSLYYVATMYDVKKSKIDAYCKSGRLKKISPET